MRAKVTGVPSKAAHSPTIWSEKQKSLHRQDSRPRLSPFYQCHRRQQRDQKQLRKCSMKRPAVARTGASPGENDVFAANNLDLKLYSRQSHQHLMALQMNMHSAEEENNQMAVLLIETTDSN